MISIFLSYPKPYNSKQGEFIDGLITYIRSRGFEPRTLGVSDYDTQEPLTAIRRLMLESNGLLTVAFRRSLIKEGISKPGSDIGESEFQLENSWLTSSYCQIEPAMAYQIGLPILILRERGVIADGVLEKGVIGTYMPEFDLAGNPLSYFNNPEWFQLIGIWEGFVRKVVQTKGQPPRLY